VAIGFVMSVHLSVRMEQIGSHWMYFDETWYLRFFQKSVKKIQVSLKSDKNNGHFMWINFDIQDILLNSSWNENFSNKSCK
jgi:hypothetical protein